MPDTPAPFRLARGDELVDDDLRAVHEVAELPFPDDERRRVGGRVAVLEAEHRLLGQRRIDDAEPHLVLGDARERNVGLAGRLVVQHRMAMEERAARRVLAGQADVVAIREQRRVGHGLRRAPVERQLVGVHARPVVDDSRDARMQRETRGRLRERLGERVEPLAVHRRRDLLRPVAIDVAAPVHRELVAGRAREGARLRAILLEALAVILHHLRGLALGQQPVLLEPLAVDLAGGRVLADRLVHDRLRRGRLVRLVVAVAAVADEVDHDVLAELHPVVEREARDEDDSLGVVGIHVEDRRLDHLGDVAAIERRSRVRGFAGREPDLVVDHDVQRPARREARAPARTAASP